jgi:hypothetical protein
MLTSVRTDLYYMAQPRITTLYMRYALGSGVRNELQQQLQFPLDDALQLSNAEWETLRRTR